VYDKMIIIPVTSNQYYSQIVTVEHNNWLIGVQRHVSTERSICAKCGGGKLAQSAKDSQQDTMHNTSSYAIAM